MTQKRKLDFIALSDEFGGYYDFSRKTMLNREGKKVYGTIYKMNSTLSEKQKEFLVSFQNVKLFYCRGQFAPEQVVNAIFLADHYLW